MKKIRGLLAFAFILLVIPFVIALLYLRPAKGRAIRQAYAKLFIRFLGLRVELVGELDPNAKMIMLNHQSFLDVIFMEAIHPKDLCWIAKKELGETPLYGHALKAPRMILINREDKKGLLFLLKETKERLEKNRVLAIFPEGTRSKGGERFLPFKSGAKVLAEKFHLPIQPIVVVGTRSIFDLAKLSVGGGKARFIALPTRSPLSSPSWYEEMREEMQQRYKEELLSLSI